VYKRKSDGTYMNAPGHEIAGHWGRSLLRNLEPFEGSNVHGYWAYEVHYPNPPTHHTAPNGHTYTLPGKPERTGRKLYHYYSYATLMAIYDPEDRTLYRNVYRYSVTTSKHQHYLWELETYVADYVVEVDPENGTPGAARKAIEQAQLTYRPEAA
jgi:hypothetical protein